MNPKDMLERIGDHLNSTATVKSVFGEPIRTDDRTVIPVARVAYGFGGGGGTGPAKSDGTGTEEAGTGKGNLAEGGGGGGGVTAIPAGALEISAAGTRFIPFTNIRMLAGVFAAGALFGVLMLRRKR